MEKIFYIVSELRFLGGVVFFFCDSLTKEDCVIANNKLEVINFRNSYERKMFQVGANKVGTLFFCRKDIQLFHISHFPFFKKLE